MDRATTLSIIQGIHRHHQLGSVAGLDGLEIQLTLLRRIVCQIHQHDSRL